jgi:hypothetical protein
MPSASGCAPSISKPQRIGIRSFQVLAANDFGEAVPVWLPSMEIAGPGPVMIKVDPVLEVIAVAPCSPSGTLKVRVIR